MKTKKLFSIILAAILMVSCVFVSVSAETSTVTVSLKGEKQAVIGCEYEVTLNIDENGVSDTVGGISCDVNYDASKFTLKRVEISEEFATANKITKDTATETINTSSEGIIKVVLLQVKGDAAVNNWLTFVFSVKGDAVSGTSWFNIDGETIKTSNAAGTELVTNDHAVDVTENVFSEKVKVNGASIRKDGVGNIRFEAEVIDITDVEEVGFLMLPTAAINNGDLIFADTGKYTSIVNGAEKPITIASNGTTLDNLTKDNKVYCYLKDSYISLATSFSARAYVKVKNSDDTYTYIYSDNIIVDNGIVGGTSSKSCIDTAKAIYEIYKDNENVTFSDGFKEIIVKDSWTETEYKTIVEELAKVEDSFN